MLDAPKILGIVGVFLTLLGRLCEDRVKSLEGKKTALESELDKYRNSSQHQTTQLNQLAQETRLEVMHHQNSPSINYKTLIVFDTSRLASTKALVNVGIDDISRLVDKLIFGAAQFRQLLETAKPRESVDNYQQLLQKSQGAPDWTDAASIKLAIVSTVVAALPLEVLGDKIIITAKKQVEYLNSGLRFGRRLVTVFYLAGVALVIYCIVKGIK
jgi:hypothetical protein